MKVQAKRRGKGPLTLDDFPACATARGRLAELERQRSELLAEIRKLRAEVEARAATFPVVSTEAAALLSNGDTFDRTHHAARDRLGELERQKGILDEAVGAQARIAQQATDRARVSVRDSWLPEHKRLAKNIATALENLLTAIAEASEFRKAFTRAGGHPGALKSITGPGLVRNALDAWAKKVRRDNYR